MPGVKSKSGGFEFDAYHAAPGDARRGGLVVVQEIFGVTPGIKQIADSFAADGYEVIAPSMYDRSERGLNVAIPDADFQKLIGYAQASFAHAQGDMQACIDALKGPVFITDRGKAAYVLMSIEDFRKLEEQQASQKSKSLAEALAQKDGGDFDFDFPEFKGSFSLKPAEFD